MGTALIGFAIGLLVGGLGGYIIGARGYVFESVLMGFGIGLAFVAVAWGINLAVKFGDKHAQKVKSGAGE